MRILPAHASQTAVPSRAQRFDIVILDEATQMTEPVSLAALIRARAKHLIVAGDPCQLGPILAMPAALTLSGESKGQCPWRIQYRVKTP